MKDGGHQRHSFPFDKRVPKMERKHKIQVAGTELYDGYGSETRQVIKKMHKKKQRQHNKKLTDNIEE